MSNCEPLPLQRVAASIFEELGFLAPTCAVSAEQAGAGEDDTASVTFEGPVSGSLVVRLYGGVLPTLAANMLGAGEAPGAEVQRDALGELTNVLCGNLLRALYGSRAVFRLYAPSVPAPEGWLPGAGHRVVLGVEAGRAEVELTLSGGAAAEPS